MNTSKKTVVKDLALLWSIENSLSYILPKFARKASCGALSNLLDHSSGRSREHRSTIEDICKYQGLASVGLFNEQLEHMLANIIGNLIACQKNDVDVILISGLREVFNYRINQYEVTKNDIQRFGLRTDHECLERILVEYKFLYSEFDTILYGILPPLAEAVES